ncbi:hypothetical protein [Streptomyces sp. NPDC051704]|uniref:hypothetical protein n=1 Tax=Streptomyces sp. NPDC051704 TaxID=3365671 RepID=UPI0037A16041
MRRTKWAAAAMVFIGLGAVSCGTSDAGTSGNAEIRVAPRPEGTGPLTKDFVRTDLEAAVTAAGLPANAPEYARGYERAPADSQLSCAVGFMGSQDGTVKVDVARYEAVLRELGKRDWQQEKKPERREDKAGKVFDAKAGLGQRGWRLSAEYRTSENGGTVRLVAFDDACMKAHGAQAPVG